MTEAEAVNRLAEELESVLADAEEELGRPLDDDERDAIVDDVLEVLSENDGGWRPLRNEGDGPCHCGGDCKGCKKKQRKRDAHILQTEGALSPSRIGNAYDADDIAKTAHWLSKQGLMPGYGQVYTHPDTGRVWYVGGDGDEDGFQRLVERKLGALRGVVEVIYESESFPPKDEGWVKIYPPPRRIGNARRKGKRRPSVGLDMSPQKACQILRDGQVHGKPLTERQRGLFGAKCGERGTRNQDNKNDGWKPLNNENT